MRHVLTASGLLRLFDDHRPPVPLCSTGFAEVDELTGGMVPGRVWVVTSAPGQGRDDSVDPVGGRDRLAAGHPRASGDAARASGQRRGSAALTQRTAGPPALVDAPARQGAACADGSCTRACRTPVAVPVRRRRGGLGARSSSAQRDREGQRSPHRRRRPGFRSQPRTRGLTGGDRDLRAHLPPTSPRCRRLA